MTTQNKRIKLMPTCLEPNELGKLCYDAYSRLGKSGKPGPNEHTVLACMVECCNELNQEPHVVALSTGTKCFPSNVTTRLTEIIDCHAESLLKRAFKLYLLELLSVWVAQNKHIRDFHKKVLSKRQYCLFVSQTPCGCFSRWQGEGKSNTDDTIQDNDLSLRKFKEVGINRKPGRGELCPKVGCIHKLAKWNVFGWQGCDLLPFTQSTVRAHRVVLGNCEPQSTTSLFPRILARLTVNLEEYHAIEAQLLQPKLFHFVPPPEEAFIQFADQFRYESFVRIAPTTDVDVKPKKPTGSSIVAWYRECNQIQNSSSKLLPMQCLVLAAGRRLGSRRAPNIPSNKGFGPAASGLISMMPPPTAQARAKYDASSGIKTIHRPVDLEVSDMALKQRVRFLIKTIQECFCMSEQTPTPPIISHVSDRPLSDVVDRDGRANIDSTLPLLQPSAKDPNHLVDFDHLRKVYQHNWLVAQANISIFKRWPCTESEGESQQSNLLIV